MKLVKVTPCRPALRKVPAYRLRYQLIDDVHSDFSQVFPHAFEHHAHDPAVIHADVGVVIEQVEASGAV